MPNKQARNNFHLTKWDTGLVLDSKVYTSQPLTIIRHNKETPFLSERTKDSTSKTSQKGGKIHSKKHE